MSDRRVVITGMGTINPLAHDVETTWKRLLAGDSSISLNELFDASTFPTKFAAQVKNFDLVDHLPNASIHESAGRHSKFAIAAAYQAWKQAGLDTDKTLDRREVGLYLGSGEGSLDFDNFISLIVDAWTGNSVDIARWAQLAQQRMDLYREVEQESNMVVSHLAAEFGLQGPAFNVLTACAASTQAIGEAYEQIRHGDTDVIVTGGAHSMIHPLGVTGFNRLTALSVRNDEFETSSRPFDMTRDGFVIGEGASILILETRERAMARGVEILAEITGYGSSADAFRITDQDPAGDGAAAAMRVALTNSNLSPDDIDYISAHGTGTQQNDEVETRAMKAVFGPRTNKIPISSVKSMLGHLIAAAGATELITCVLALRDNIVPPTQHLLHADPNCDLDYVPNKSRKTEVNIAMSNSMGFGGQNNTLIVTKSD